MTERSNAHPLGTAETLATGSLRAMADPPPDVFSYLDHRRFLKDWFEWKKRSNPRFSHRLFARLAGQKNPSLLCQVIGRQRNLTQRTLPGFLDALGLDEEERQFFTLLVQLDAASSPGERDASWERIRATGRFQARVNLSSWFIPAVWKLATCAGFQADPDWIARTLRPPITRTEAEQALDTLFELGLLQRHLDGSVGALDDVLSRSQQGMGGAVHDHDGAMLGRALDAIERFDATERHLGGVTVAIPESQVEQLKRELSGFQARILSLCERCKGPKDRVYQLSLQLFPLSTRITSEEG